MGRGCGGCGGFGDRGGWGRRYYGNYQRYYAPGYYQSWPYQAIYAAPVVASSYYGSCDRSLQGTSIANNCTEGYPVATPTNCACFHVPSQSFGCFDTRGASC